MTAILRNVLDQHRRAGGHALLMSATLGSAARAKLLKVTGRADPPAFEVAIATPYPTKGRQRHQLDFRRRHGSRQKE